MRLALSLLLASFALAQQTVAPTPEAVGTPRGQNVGGYNVLNSFELGWRFNDVNGDMGKYRSDVNYGNGLRLLASELRVNSREGRGRLFDEFLLRTQGLGNDPYEFSTLRLEKNGLYRYELTWRLNRYFNPAQPFASGLHAMNTERRLQDHDLSVSPWRRLKLLAGYSRNLQEGPALSTARLTSLGTDEFPLMMDLWRLQNEYRAGAEATLSGFRVTLLRGWTRYSEHPRHSIGGPAQGLDPSDPAALDSFARSERYRGSSPYWSANVFREDELWSANARFTHVDGDRSFFFDEVLSGTSSFGAAQNRQIVVAGNGRQPVTSGNLAFYLFPRGALTVANQTSFYNRRLEGDNSFRELDNASLSLALLNFQLLGIRTISNTTDATYRAAKWLGIYGGYRYASRRIRSVEQEEFFGQADAVRAEQDNRLHSGLLGFRLRPVQGLTVNVDGEIGRADRPFFPIGRRNFHLLRARAQYKRGTLSLGVSARANYNFNSVSLAQHSARSRDYMLTGSWTPRSWFAIDGTYSKIHLDTLSGVAYFSMGELLSGRSAYLSNIHTGIVTARFEFLGRAALSAGFSRVRDTADPGASSGLFSDPVAFPLTFDSPLARFSVRIHQRLRLNAGYQFYRYDERLLPRDYRAHTGYTSLSWSF